MAHILVEARNLALRHGTGIATYSRGLKDVLGTLGHTTDAIIQTSFKPTSNTLANEIALFDFEARSLHEKKRKKNFFEKWARLHERYVSDLRGTDAQRITIGDIVADPTQLPGLDGFSNVYGVQHLFDRADNFLRRTGSPLDVRVDTSPDLVHLTHPTPIRVANKPTVVTVHDIVPLRMPHTTLDDKAAFLRTLDYVTHHADHIVTVSDASKEDLLKYFNIKEERITTTHQSLRLPPELLARSDEDTARDLSTLSAEPGGYFLFVGAIEPKKNISRLFDAYLSSGSKRPLLLAGPSGWSSERDLARVQNNINSTGNQQPRIIQLSYVPFYLLLSLIRHARSLLFPSLYEGFGLPALEAMALGTPVLTSNTSSLPEVVGEAAVTVDPYSTFDLAAAIKRLDQDDDLCAELRKQGPIQAAKFSHDAHTKKMASVYARLL